MRPQIHNIGKPLLWTTFLVVLIITQITMVKATPETTVKVEPYQNTAQVGETFTINITLTDVQNLYGVEVILRWDASVLQVVDVDVRLGIESYSDGVLHEEVLIWENETIQEEGKYKLVGVSLAPADPFSGSGNIVIITFNVTDVGSCKLYLETELTSPPAAEWLPAPLISHSTKDGFFSPIAISASPMIVTVGENVNISGFIIPAQKNVGIIILYRQQGETDWSNLPTVITDAQGNYQYTWQPQERGKYEIGATAIIEGKEVTSTSFFITVETPEQPAWIYIAIIIVVIVIVVIAAIVMYLKRIKKS